MRAPLSHCLALSLACAACAGNVPKTDLAPGEQPALDSVEAGLRMQMARAEDTLKTSGRLEDDPELEAYLREVLCRLTAEYCGDMRIYVVNAPAFNATMAPNGAMQVWSGLLLRSRNEAELAFVLGHEFGHFLKRHSSQRWEDTKGKTGAMVFVSFATAAAGVGFIGLMTNFALLDSIFSYSRDQEREADEHGAKLMIAAGYDPDAAVAIFSRLDEEKDADPETKGKSIFFSTHPLTKERVKTLERIAETAKATGRRGELGTERFLAATQRFRTEWLRQEMKKRTYARTELVLDHIEETGVDTAEIAFFRGELHRLRDEDGDEAKAVAAYEQALKSGYAPPELHRALGLLHWSAKRDDAARTAFERYLRAAPKADDRLIIESYLNKLKQEAHL